MLTIPLYTVASQHDRKTQIHGNLHTVGDSDYIIHDNLNMVGESDYTIHDNLNMVGESDCTIQVHVGEESAPKKQHTYNYIYNLYTTKV